MKNKYIQLQPVFITGTPRSGTTLLYRTLLKHSSFQSKRLSLDESRVFLYSFLAIESKQVPNQLLGYMLDDEVSFEQYLESITHEKFWQGICKNLRFSLFLSEDTHWTFALNERVIKKFFYYAKKVRECNRIVEKTPKHLLHSKRIFRTFPQSKMLITIRHPVEIFSSYRKRKQIDAESKWLDITAEEFVNRYSHMMEHVKTLKAQNKARCLKYEDFISDPENKFREICDYLDEPFESDPVKESEPRLSYWKVDPYLSKPITKKTKDWSEYLNTDEVKFIEHALNDEMDSFKYSSVLSSQL